MRTRCLWAAALLAPALVLGTTVFVSPALALSGEESRLLTLTNQARASAGAGPLAVDEGVSSVARAWAQQMGAAGGISHNPNYTSQISGWSRVGENVGMGGSVDMVHQALMASPGHRSNIVNSDFTVVGIGVARTGNTVWVVQNFVTPRGSVARSAPTPAAAPAPAAEARAPRRSATTTPPRPKAAPAPEPAAPAPPPPPPAPPAPTRSPADSPTLAFVLDTLRAFDKSVRR